MCSAIASSVTAKYEATDAPSSSSGLPLARMGAAELGRRRCAQLRLAGRLHTHRAVLVASDRDREPVCLHDGHELLPAVRVRCRSSMR